MNIYGVELEPFIRLFVSFLLSGLIGYEREVAGKPAGFRTHILVGISTTLMTMMMYEVKVGDPGRIPAAVIAGVGFIGAGTILKEGEKIIGITTAATLWAVAAIALACGYGRLDLGISVAILSYVTLKLRPLESRIRGEKKS